MKTNWCISLRSYFFSAITAAILGGCGGSAELLNEYDTLPKLREYTPPTYPEKFLLSQENAEVVLSLRVDEAGNVRGVTILKSSGQADLDSAALIAAKKWRYHPASKGGKPVPIVVHQKVLFSTKLTESISFYEIVVSRKDLADSLASLLESGADFSEIAKRYSEAPSASHGGFRETVRYDTLPAAVRVALERLAPGQLSPPFELNDGRYMIIKRKRA